MRSGTKEIYLVDECNFLCAHPESAKMVNKKIREYLKTFESVKISIKNVKIITPEFIRIAFCEFKGMTQKQVQKRVLFKATGMDEHKRYLISAERKRAREAEKARLKSQAAEKTGLQQ